MALPIKKFREIVLQILFARGFEGALDEDLLPFVMKELCVTKKWVKLALVRAEEIEASKDEFDSLIQAHAKAYDLERIALAERQIMRLSLFDLLKGPALPAKTVISEAVRLTRKFGTRDSARFVNAVLDAIYHEKTPEASLLIKEECPT